MTTLRKLISAALMAILLLGTLTPTAGAVEQSDQAQYQQDGRTSATTSRAIAQVFTVGKAGSLTKVRVLVDRNAGPGDLRVELRPVWNGQPDGSAIASGVLLNADATSGNPTWEEVALTNPPLVNVGEQYALVLTPTDDLTTYYWYTKTGGPYTNGNPWTQDGGTWQEWSNFDFAFQSVVDVPSSDATLNGITLSAGFLSPKFSSSWYSYNVKVTSTTTELLVTPTPTVATATVTVNGQTPDTPVPLAYGENQVYVLVTAEDGTTTQTYDLLVTREASTTTSRMTTTTTTTATPTIAGPGDQTVDEDTTVGLAYTVSGLDSATTNLTVASSDQTIVDNNKITANFDGTSWNVTVVPEKDAAGSVLLTATAQDSTTASVTHSHTITFAAVNDSPIISDIPDQGVAPGGTVGPIAFTVSDPDSKDTLYVTPTSGNTTLVPPGNIVVEGTGTTRTITVTPDANQTQGSALITVEVSDGTLATTDTFVVNLNAAPTISTLTNKTIAEDTTSLTYSFKVTDPDGNAGNVKVTVDSSNPDLLSPEYTVTNTGGNVVVTMIPVRDQFGTSTITVTATDETQVSSTASFLLTITNVNDAPTIPVIVDQSTDEEVPVEIPFTVDDSDSDLASLTFFGSAGNKTLVPDENIVFSGSGTERTVTVTPAQDQVGTTTISITVSDGKASTTRYFTLVVKEVNDTPTISPIPDMAVAINEPVPSIPFTIGDLETTAANLKVTATSSNQGLVPDGNMTLGGSGTNRWLSVLPLQDVAQATTITITVTDGEGLFIQDSFVLSVSHRPTVSVISDVTINEDTETEPIGFAIGDVETLVQDLVVTAVSDNQALVPNGNIILPGTTDPAERWLRIIPAANKFGVAVITLTVSDGALDRTESFKVTVNPINDTPTITPISDLATTEGVATSPLTFTIGDLETAPTSLVVTVSSSNPALVSNENMLLGGVSADRTITITPVAHQSGETLITVTVSDGYAEAKTSFILTVTAVNDAPVVVAPSTFSGAEDKVSLINVKVVDYDTPASSLQIVVNSLAPDLVNPENIKVTGSAGSWTLAITPEPNASGTAPIQISATDGSQVTNHVIQMQFSLVNDLPTISTPTPVGIEEDTPTQPIPFTVGDVETAESALVVTATSDNQALLPDSGLTLGGKEANRSLTITPAADKFGTAMVYLTVDDGQGKTTVGFPVTVTPVLDAPRITGMKDSTIKEDTVLSLTVGLTDPDTPEAEVTWQLFSSNEELVPVANLALTGVGPTRTLAATPVANRSGTTMITMVATDADGLSTMKAFVLTVTPVNDLPEVTPLSNLQTLEESPTAAMTFLISDVESDAALLTVTASSSDTAVVPLANIHLGGSGTSRTVSVTPALNRTGTVTISLHIADGTGSTTIPFTLTILGINDPPSFTLGNDVIVGEDAGPQSFNRWMPAVSAGPYEPEQRVTFSVSTDNPDLFAVPPRIAADGTLTFTAAENTSGSAEVTVSMKDDGGTENGGLDTAPPATFTITVNPVNDLPVISEIGLQGTEMGVPTLPIAFTIADVETLATDLVVTATSSDQAVVADGNIQVFGTGMDRSLLIRPTAQKTGVVMITIAVSDGTATATRTFELRVSNVFLSDLETSLGQLVPVFEESAVTYKVIYNRNATEVFLTPTARDPVNLITVNGFPVVSGQESQPVPVSGSGGEAWIVVTAPATGVSKTYQVEFVRAKSAITDLFDLSISPGLLEPAFQPDVTEYTATVESEVTEVIVTATPADGHAKVEVVGNTDLKVGANTVQVIVTAENGLQKTYTIAVTRKAPPLAIQNVKILANVDSAAFSFETSGAASAEIFFGQTELTVDGLSAGSGASHSARLQELEPGTTYKYRIAATAGEYRAEYAGSFTTPSATAGELTCRYGTIRREDVGRVSLLCPANGELVESIADALPETVPPTLVAVNAVGESELLEGLNQAVKGTKSGQSTELVVATGEERPVKAAVVDAAGARLAIQAGSDVTVQSSLGGLTLSPTALATMIQGGEGGKLITLFEAVPAGRADVADQLVRPEWQRLSEVVDATAMTLYADGTVERHTSLSVPVVLTLKFDPAQVKNPSLVGIFQLVEDELGNVVDRLYVGGVADMEKGTISVTRDHLSKYVVLGYEQEFSDLAPTHWAYKTIQQMAARGVVDGLTPTTFGPDVPVTRGQFASMLTRAFNLERAPHLAKGYKDVEEESALAGEIGGVMKVGLMVGYPDATFRPNAQITRQELATVLNRLIIRLQIQVQPVTSKNAVRISGFQDKDEIAEWSWESVQAMVDLGLMTGRPGPTFAPGGQATRAEAVTVVKRLLDLMERSGN